MRVLVVLVAIGLVLSVPAPVHAQAGRSPDSRRAAPLIEPPAVQEDPVALGQPLSYWMKAVRDRDPRTLDLAFDAIVELGPQAWRAVPELTRIVSAPFTPIRIDKDSPREVHSKLLEIHFRAGAVDGLGAIGEAAAPSAEAVIRWGLTMRTLAPDKYPAVHALLLDLIGIDVLERMRAAGAVAHFGPDAAGPVQALLTSPDYEQRKFSVAILNDAAVPIAADLMNSESCGDRMLGLSLLGSMWPVVPRDHLDTLQEMLACSPDQFGDGVPGNIRNYSRPLPRPGVQYSR